VHPTRQRSRSVAGLPPSTNGGFLARLVEKPLFWALFLLVAFALPVGRSMMRTLPRPPAALAAVAPFNLHDQDGHPVALDDLRGKVWVADFIPIQPTKPSDDLSKTMSRVRYRARNLSYAFHLVTISVDPVHDDLASRKKYAERFHASPATWQFLGGTSEEVEAALQSFQITADANPTLAEFSRRERIVLVDQNAHVRGTYATDLSSIDALVADIGLLANLTPGTDGTALQ
jgi:protein SCO1/2